MQKKNKKKKMGDDEESQVDDAIKRDANVYGVIESDLRTQWK